MIRLVTRARNALLVMALALAGACADTEPAAEADEGATLARQEPMPADELGTVGARIYLDPGAADAVLQEVGLTPETFRSRVKEISTDPREARIYAEAFQAEAGADADGSPAGSDGEMERPGG